MYFSKTKSKKDSQCNFLLRIVFWMTPSGKKVTPCMTRLKNRRSPAPTPEDPNVSKNMAPAPILLKSKDPVDFAREYNNLSPRRNREPSLCGFDMAHQRGGNMGGRRTFKLGTKSSLGGMIFQSQLTNL
jgi:hypothetical protein